MKKLLSLLLCVGLLLSVLPGAFADLEGEPQQCVDLILECNPSTGYGWTAQSSNEEIAYLQELGITTQEEDPYLVGAPATAAFRIAGNAPGDAVISLSYSRPWESVQPLIQFTVPVTVDQGLNVLTGTEISLPREEGTGWAFEMAEGGILEITDEGGQEAEQRFTLRPLKDGFEEITFTLFSGEGQLPGVFTYRVRSEEGALSAYEIEYRSAAASSFDPAFTFTSTDFEGNTVTEQIFAGHSLTILNFWEPWCGLCVAEMPFLEQLSQEYAEKGVQVVGVFSPQNPDQDVQEVLDGTGVTYPNLRYVREFGFLQTGYVPNTVMIDGTGAIVYGPVAGALNYAGWCALVDKLLS